LVITLALVALLPLAAALVFTVDRWSEVRKEQAAEGAVSVASAQARGLAVTLVKDAQTFEITLQDSQIVLILSQPTEGAAHVGDDRARTTMPANPIARTLMSVKHDPRVVDVTVTDRTGLAVGSTRATDNLSLAGDPWWRETYNDGRGAIVLSHVEYDNLARTHTIDISFPILAADRIVGVALVQMDLAKWMQDSIGTVPDSPTASMLIDRRDGRIVYAPGVAPLSATEAHWSGPIAEGQKPGWRISDGEIQAYVPVSPQKTPGEIQTRFPDWVLVAHVSQNVVMRPVYHFALLALAAGFAVIALIFLGGLLLVDRVVVRRLRRLQQATHKVAGGDFTGRVDTGGAGTGLLGADEIDELTSDFNDMVGRVRRSHDELVSADELKTNFIRVAGHELRTPVSYILGLVKLLKDNTDSDRLQQAMQSVGARARRLDDIIRAMFKLMPDKMHDEAVHYSDVSIPELLEEVYLDCFPFVERRKQRLIVDSSLLKPNVRADREKLLDIIENLVINAIKFTPDGGQVRLLVSSELEGYVSISVKDQGPGIPEKELPHLFQPFYSGGEVLQHSSGEGGHQKRGLGLGLAIVRRFVELHGGTVSVASSPEGSTFTVVIPVAIQQTAP